MTAPARGDARQSRYEWVPVVGEPDPWDNLILAVGSMRQYVCRSQWDGRAIRVCGEMVSGKHVIWWTFDEAQMRPVCELCFPQWRHEEGRR